MIKAGDPHRRDDQRGCFPMETVPLIIKNPSGWFGGPQPSEYNPNPATCAADSEACAARFPYGVFRPGGPEGREENAARTRKRTPQADFFDTQRGCFPMETAPLLPLF